MLLKVDCLPNAVDECWVTIMNFGRRNKRNSTLHDSIEMALPWDVINSIRNHLILVHFYDYYEWNFSQAWKEGPGFIFVNPTCSSTKFGEVGARQGCQTTFRICSHSCLTDIGGQEITERILSHHYTFWSAIKFWRKWWNVNICYCKLFVYIIHYFASSIMV